VENGGDHLLVSLMNVVDLVMFLIHIFPLEKNDFIYLLVILQCFYVRVTHSQRAGCSQNKHPSEAKLRAASFRNTLLGGNYPKKFNIT
jgi:hypothetical protein